MTTPTLKVGRHLIVGFEGTEPSTEFLDFLAAGEIGGVILFARNLKNREQIAALIAQLKKAGGEELLVGVDHEGGRVFRLPPPFTQLPPARQFGKEYEKTGDSKPIEEIAESVARELCSVGFNLNFAPVLDVDTCAENPIIGDRAFHRDPEIVAQVGAAFVRGFAKGGILSCGKHFPGHGDTKEDSHKTLPLVEKTRDKLAACELVPFKKLITAGIPALMTAHVLYLKLDPKNCATLSPPILDNILRHQLGFQGVLFSDDLLMKGVTKRLSVPEAAVQALTAGCDAVLICRDFELQKQSLHTLRKSIQQESQLNNQLTLSQNRLERLYQKSVGQGPPKGPNMGYRDPK